MPTPAPASAVSARSILLSWAAPLLYAAIFCSIYSDVVLGQAAFIRRDIARFYYPMWHFGSSELSSGRLPLWNPLNNFGSPFFANVQTCVFYPLSALFYLPDFSYGFNLFIVVHLILSACFTYLWMRDSGCSRAGSFLAGAAFSLGGWSFSTLNLTISLASAAYFPLGLLCLRRALSGSRAWQAATAAVLLAQFLAGDPAVLFATLLTMGVFCVYRTFELSLRARKPDLSPLARFVPVAAIFFGSAAFQMIPFLELVSSSIRSSLRFDEAMMWSMHYNDLAGIVVPFFTDLSMYVMDYWTRQSWLENYYLGVTVAALAVAGAWAPGRDPKRGHLVLLALFGLTLALGRHSLVYPAMHQFFPWLGLVRYPVRFYFLFAFAVACLAGFGLDALGRADARRGKGPYVLLASALALAAAAITWSIGFAAIEARVSEWALGRYGETVKPFYAPEELRGFVCAALSNARRSAYYLALCSLGIAAVLLGRPRRAVAMGFFVLLALFDLGTSNLIEPRVTPGLLEQPTGNIREVLKDDGLFRVMASPKTVYKQTYTTLKAVESTQEDQKEQLTSNFLMLQGIEDALGYDSIYVKDTSRIQSELMKLKDPAAVRILDWLNIRYLASPREELPGFELVRRAKPANLYRNPDALPRAFLSRRAEAEPDRERLLEKILSPGYDAEEALWIEDLSAAGPAEAAGADAGELLRIEHGARRVEMDVRVADRPWLFLSDAYAAGWRATSDGKPLKVHRANFAFRAVRLEPGRHHVVWEYLPASFLAGGAVTCVTIVLAAGWAGMPSRSLSFKSAASRMSL